MGATLPTVAYIAEHRLFVKRPGQPAEPVESVFAEQLFDRDAERRQRHGWRGGNPLWGSLGEVEQMNVLPAINDARPLHFNSVTRAAGTGEMLYVMQIGSMGGLFHYKLDEEYERRLVHRQNYEVTDVAVHPTQDLLACSVQYDDGSCNLAKADREGRKLVEITRGDSRDESPSWVPGESGTRILYQTAGIGRDVHGIRSRLGPYRIAMLDLDSGVIEDLCQDDRHDFLSPRQSLSGDLYYIRRTYDPRPVRVGLLTQIKDAALFPFRLVRAFIHFFNAFSMIFSGKPLYTAGGPKQQGPDAVRLMLWGRLVDAQESQRRAGTLRARPMVPGDWQLCVQRANRRQDTLASHVVAYDLCEDGSVVYSNGHRVIHRTQDGTETPLDESRLVHKVAVLG